MNYNYISYIKINNNPNNNTNQFIKKKKGNARCKNNKFTINISF